MSFGIKPATSGNVVISSSDIINTAADPIFNASQLRSTNVGF